MWIIFKKKKLSSMKILILKSWKSQISLVNNNKKPYSQIYCTFSSLEVLHWPSKWPDGLTILNNVILNSLQNVQSYIQWSQEGQILLRGTVTAGKFRKSVSLHIPLQAGNTVVCSKEKVSGHSAYESNEETHVKSLSPAHLVKGTSSRMFKNEVFVPQSKSLKH